MKLIPTMIAAALIAGCGSNNDVVIVEESIWEIEPSADRLILDCDDQGTLWWDAPQGGFYALSQEISSGLLLLRGEQLSFREQENAQDTAHIEMSAPHVSINGDITALYSLSMQFVSPTYINGTFEIEVEGSETRCAGNVDIARGVLVIGQGF